MSIIIKKNLNIFSRVWKNFEVLGKVKSLRKLLLSLLQILKKISEH